MWAYFHWIKGCTESYHELRFEKESRYYVLRLEKDLLNDWTITAVNGRIKSKLGQSRTFPFENYEQAFIHLCSLSSIRYQRKYHLVSYKTPSALFMQCFISFLNNKIWPEKAQEEGAGKNIKRKLAATIKKPRAIAPLKAKDAQISFSF